MTYGFEREYFVVNMQEGLAVAADLQLPHDGCGYLAEARGEPHYDPLTAYYLFLRAEHALHEQLPKGFRLVTDTPQKPSKTFKHDCMRRFGKHVQTDFSMSGRWNASGYAHAGLHVHFGNIITVDKTFPNGGEFHYRGVGLINIPALVLRLDKQFKGRIKEAKRALGLYKLTDHGFEYRSLPASMSPLTVAEFIKSDLRGIR